MHRRNWLASFVALLTLAFGAQLTRAEKQITLTDRLKAGLKCRRPEEFAFVESVVVLVDQKKLKTDLVLSTYRWAVEQRPDFPFFYFQYGLRRRAAAVGVTL